jgi:hypothetical protein
MRGTPGWVATNVACARKARSIFESGVRPDLTASDNAASSDARTHSNTASQIDALSGKWRNTAPCVTPIRSAIACVVIASGPRSRASCSTASTISRRRSLVDSRGARGRRADS